MVNLLERVRPSAGRRNEHPIEQRNTEEQVTRYIERMAGSERDLLLARSRRRFPSLSDEDREDCLQQAMVSALKDCRATDYRGTIAFVATVAQNRMIDLLRQRRRRGEHTDIEPHEEMIGDDKPKPDEMLEMGERRSQLATLVKELRPTTQHVLRLRYMDEMSAAEVQTALGITRKQYEGHLTRGLKELKLGFERFEPRTLPIDQHEAVVRFIDGTASREEQQSVRELMRRNAEVREYIGQSRRRLREAAAMLPVPILLGGATGPFGAVLTALGFQPKLGTVAATKSTGTTGATAGTTSTATGVGASSAAGSAAVSSAAVTGAAATGAASTVAGSGAVGIGGIAAALGVGKAVAIGASVATIAIVGVGTAVVATQNNSSTEANEIARGIVPSGAIPGAQPGFETVAVVAADRQADAAAQARQERADKAKAKANAKKQAAANSAVVAQPEEIVVEEPVIVEEPSSPSSGNSGGSSNGSNGNSRSSKPDNNSSSSDSDSGEFVVTPVD